MSNWRQPSSQQEEKRVLNAWNFNARMPASVQNYDTNNGIKGKEMRGMVSDDSSNSTKNPWNQIFMQHDIDTQKNGDYKLSSSLKTLWNDVSDGSSQNVDLSSTANHAGVYNTTQTSVGNDSQSKSVRTVGPGLMDNNIAVANSLHSNLLKGRAITARNGSYTPCLGNENANSNQSSNSPLSLDQHLPLEKFLQKVQLIVKNGFLDPKILNEPISPETFDLVQMLIFYVMEYSKTRNYSNSDTNNPALCDEIQNLFYKINLIQNEIARCQLQYVQQKRIQDEILQSFSQLDGLVLKQPNLNGQQFCSNQTAVAMSANGNRKYNEHPSGGDLTPAANTCGSAFKENNERFNQRQFDQFAQQSNASSSGKFAFLPKTKNIEKRSHFYEQNPYFAQRDGHFTTH